MFCGNFNNCVFIFNGSQCPHKRQKIVKHEVPEPRASTPAVPDREVETGSRDNSSGSRDNSSGSRDNITASESRDNSSASGSRDNSSGSRKRKRSSSRPPTTGNSTLETPD
ncbi:hypothetical protein BsWGS_01006 [Bradybaena similaris]